jgi:hypothetical protein
MDFSAIPRCCAIKCVTNDSIIILTATPQLVESSNLIKPFQITNQNIEKFCETKSSPCSAAFYELFRFPSDSDFFTVEVNVRASCAKCLQKNDRRRGEKKQKLCKFPTRLRFPALHCSYSNLIILQLSAGKSFSAALPFVIA